MGLDFHAAADQISGMASDVRISRSQRERRLLAASHALDQPLARPHGDLEQERFWQRIEAAAARKVTWLVAAPTERLEGDVPLLGARHPAVSAPSDYVALATDGSQIDVDRHGPAHCFLINIGGALLRYGSQHGAELFSEPHLYSRDDQLSIVDPAGGIRVQAIEGPVLGIKRMVMECEALERRLRDLAAGTPVLALLDGSLVLWELNSDRYPDFVQAHLLEEGLLPALDGLYEQRQSGPLAFASYISRPRSTEVLNILRVAHCPHDGLDSKGCDFYCGRAGIGKKECDEVARGLMDRDLFEQLLEPGERSAVFASQSPIMKRYGRHRINFFYVNVGGEIARVETPKWFADEPGAIDLLHATLLDQCRKGRGYPVALQEAHERAVVTASDRRYFWALVEATLEEQGVGASSSEKARSKRVRAL